jgi:hypothetical protein
MGNDHDRAVGWNALRGRAITKCISESAVYRARCGTIA